MIGRLASRRGERLKRESLSVVQRSDRWLVGSAHRRISRGEPWSGQKKKFPRRKNLKRTMPGEKLRASSRCELAHTVRRAPTPSCLQFVLDRADAIIDGVRQRSCRFALAMFRIRRDRTLALSCCAETRSQLRRLETGAACHEGGAGIPFGEANSLLVRLTRSFQP
jgi:hypothetical protein